VSFLTIWPGEGGGSNYNYGGGMSGEDDNAEIKFLLRK
jgi:hypothetical protein